MGLARICAGGAGELAFLPQSFDTARRAQKCIDESRRAQTSLNLERFPLRLNRDSQSGRKGGVSGRDSPSGGCPYGQAVFVGFA